MNVAGIMPNNVDYVAQAFAAESGSLQPLVGQGLVKA